MDTSPAFVGVAIRIDALRAWSGDASAADDGLPKADGDKAPPPPPPPERRVESNVSSCERALFKLFKLWAVADRAMLPVIPPTITGGGGVSDVEGDDVAKFTTWEGGGDCTMELRGAAGAADCWGGGVEGADVVGVDVVERLVDFSSDSCCLMGVIKRLATSVAAPALPSIATGNSVSPKSISLGNDASSLSVPRTLVAGAPLFGDGFVNASPRLKSILLPSGDGSHLGMMISSDSNEQQHTSSLSPLKVGW